MAVKLNCGHWGEICSACDLVRCFICDREHLCVVKTDRIIWGAGLFMVAVLALLIYWY